MNFPNLGPLCCMPRPKIMRISQTLREMLQCIRARGLFQEKNEEIMNKEWEAQK